MRNLLSCLQSFAFRPTSVAVVAPRHGSYTFGLLSLHMAWKRLISNLNVVFQGAKKAVKVKKKNSKETLENCKMREEHLHTHPGG